MALELNKTLGMVTRIAETGNCFRASTDILHLARPTEFRKLAERACPSRPERKRDMRFRVQGCHPRMGAAHLVVSINRGPQSRPQNTVIP